MVLDCTQICFQPQMGPDVIFENQAYLRIDHKSNETEAESLMDYFYEWYGNTRRVCGVDSDASVEVTVF